MSFRIQKSTAKVVLFFVLVGLGLLALLSWARMQRVQAPEAASAKVDAQRWQQVGALWVLRGSTMGTRYQISLRGVEATRLPELEVAVEARLEAINASMSTYREDSEITRFNRASAPWDQELSEDFAAVWQLSLEVAQKSQGAFDPTVGPLLRAWGFGAGAKAKAAVPDEAALAKIRASIGYSKLIWDAPPRRLRKESALELDLSAVAKGYGVAAVAQLLRERGVAHAMVEIGGEVQAFGRPSAARWWQIGIERPSARADSAPVVQEVMALADRGMATSGDYRNFIEKGGKRRSHTMDPRTGAPVEHGAASVTVLASDAGRADAWATALMVLGPQAGLDFAQQEDLAVMFVLREGEGFVTRESPAWTRYTQRFAPQPAAQPPKAPEPPGSAKSP